MGLHSLPKIKASGAALGIACPHSKVAHLQSEGEIVLVDPTWPLDVFARSVAEYTAPGSIEFSQYPVLGELSVRITTTFEVLGGCCLCDRFADL